MFSLNPFKKKTSEFAKLGLSTPLVDCVKNKGYDSPTPIQAKVILPILESKDVMAASQTGTGKTAAFTLPILDRLRLGTKAKPNHVRALILSPTRELSAQIAQSVTDYGAHLICPQRLFLEALILTRKKDNCRKAWIF